MSRRRPTFGFGYEFPPGTGPEPRPYGSIEVFVRNPNGYSGAVTTTPSTKVSAFIRQLEEEGIMNEPSEVTFMNLVLRNSKTLGHYNIRDGATVELIPLPRLPDFYRAHGPRSGPPALLLPPLPRALPPGSIPSGPSSPRPSSSGSSTRATYGGSRPPSGSYLMQPSGLTAMSPVTSPAPSPVPPSTSSSRSSSSRRSRRSRDSGSHIGYYSP